MFKDTPKWFLALALTILLAVIPSWVHLNNRITLVEALFIEAQKDRDRFLRVIDKMDDNLGELATAIAELRVEVKNLKKDNN